ncbi:plant UBX domain-containing protein 9-like [Phaseolus vulgaris]|uniref:plant UBX domain-containing protein 9-like n=1 Tax=Phaseolus vulgaris TaxID=3885 RepID=UPI0035CB317E
MSDGVAESINITGAPESVPVQKWKKYASNLNDARNAHFLEEHKLLGEGKNVAAAPQSVASIQPWIQAAKMEKGECSSSSVKVDILNDSSDDGLPQPFESLPPPTSHLEEVTKVAAFEPIRQTGLMRNDSEKERIKAAEASRKFWEGVSRWKQTVCNDLSQGWLPKTRVQQQDSNLNSAIASSIQTENKEKAVPKLLVKEDDLGVHDLVDKKKKTNSSRNQLEVPDPQVSQAVEESQKCICHALLLGVLLCCAARDSTEC